MKRVFLLFVAMITMLLGLQAQSQPNTTDDALDSAEQLNVVLQNVLQQLADIKQSLNYVMANASIDNPFMPDKNGVITNCHEYVDLGVVVNGKPVYWATANIGAELPDDCGLYFAWGETVGYGQENYDGHVFDRAYYSQYDVTKGDNGDVTKYKASIRDIRNQIVLKPEDDAAHVAWGGDWRMPTKEEFDALVTQCDWTWVETKTNPRGIVNGYIVSNKADSSKFIFLPAVGMRFSYYPVFYNNERLFYWSSWLDMRDIKERPSTDAFILNALSDNKQTDRAERWCGLPVRAVISR